MIPKPPKKKHAEGSPQPEQPEDEHAERDDYLEEDALDAHGHGEQPEHEREADLAGTPAAHQPRE
jgi:hypothetical protein